MLSTFFFFACTLMWTSITQLFAFKSILTRNNCRQQNSVLFEGYGFFKKDGEKKDVGRLLKNIIFPGIYVEYADTQEVKKTIKIESDVYVKSRYEAPSFFSQESKSGSFNMVKNIENGKLANDVQVPLKKVTKPVGFVPPVPKKAVAIGGGVKCIPNVNTFLRPKKPIFIYEDEASGECRMVREACSMLDLVVEYRPCPGSTGGYSDVLSTVTLGKRTIPFMIDNNPSMYRPSLTGSVPIITHLFSTYGPGESSIPKSLLGNGSKGASKSDRKARWDSTKMLPITLFGWEGAQYVKPVRDALTQLGLSHVMINCAAGSGNRSKLTSKTGGVFQVPYISDPNTGVDMFESAEIVKYLTQTYTV